jgi:uncharacterized protein (TIGR03437 family)
MTRLRRWWRFTLMSVLPLAAQQNCVFTLTPGSVSVPATTFPVFQGSFRVDANLNNCQRTAVSNSNWLTVQLGQTGTGDGIVGYAVENNLTPNTRSGTITVGNAAFTVNQAGNSCRTTLTLQGGSGVGADGGSRVLNVETSCQWTAVSNAAWLAVAEPAGRAGNGSVQLNIARNMSPASRTGNVSVGNQSVTITQAGANCSYAFSPAALQVGSGGGTVTAALQANCEWTATSSASWARVTPPASGSGSGTVTIVADPNGTATEGRTASITAGSANLTVTQPPAPCNTQFTPVGASVPAAGGAGTIVVNTSCATWTVQTTAPWVRVTQGASSIIYNADPNPDAQPRAAEIRAGQAVFSLTQAGAACTYTTSPQTIEVPADGGRFTIQVTSGSGCAWTASSDAGWFRRAAEVVGQSVTFEADANPSGDARTATVTIATRTVAVRQAGQGAAPRITAAGVVSAASYAGGGVSPGEIITVFGQNLGPAELVGLELTGNGRVATQLGGVRVLFDGIAAPLVYAAAGQLSAVVPYAIAGRGQINLQTEYRGVRSNAIALPVLTAKPALFSVDSSGGGPGAILNEDGSVNGVNRPARPGSVVVLFGTGEGLPEPVPEDGSVTGALPLPRPVLPVRVTIGGRDAEVLYAGSAPSLVAGVLQLNVLLPAGVSGSALAIRVSVGEVSSTDAVTVAVVQ